MDFSVLNIPFSGVLFVPVLTTSADLFQQFSHPLPRRSAPEASSGGRELWGPEGCGGLA